MTKTPAEVVREDVQTLREIMLDYGDDEAGPRYTMEKRALNAAIAALSAMEGEAAAWGRWAEGLPPGTRLLRYDGKPLVDHQRSEYFNVPLYTAPPPQQAEDTECLNTIMAEFPGLTVHGAVERIKELLVWRNPAPHAACGPTPSVSMTVGATHPTPSPGPQGGGEGKVLRLTARQVKVAEFALRRFANDARLGADYAAQKSGADKYPEGASARFLRDANDIEAILAALDTPPQPEAAVADIGLTSRPLPKVTARMTDAASGIDKRLSVFKLSDIFKAMHAHPDYQKQLDTFTAATVAALTTSGRDGDG